MTRPGRDGPQHAQAAEVLDTGVGPAVRGRRSMVGVHIEGPPQPGVGGLVIKLVGQHNQHLVVEDRR